MVLDMLALDMPLNKSPSKSSVSLNKTIWVINKCQK
jgi:hypothetical protein